MSEWEILGGDPAPGRPDQIDCGVQTLQRTGAAVEQIKTDLVSINDRTDSSNWDGASASAFRASMGDFIKYLDPIATSFESCGKALAGHSRALTDLQRRARQALARAKAAEQKRQKTSQDLERSRDYINQQRTRFQASQNAEMDHYQRSMSDYAAGDPTVISMNAQRAQQLEAHTVKERVKLESLHEDERILVDQHNGHVADLRGAREQARAIRREWDEESRRCAKAVGDSLEGALRNKGWFRGLIEGAANYIGGLIDDIAEFVSNPSFENLRKALDATAGLIGLIGIVACIVAAPFTGGTTLALMGLVAGAISANLLIAKTGVTAFMWLRGDDGISWTDVAKDGIDAAIATAFVAAGAGVLGRAGAAGVAPIRQGATAGVRFGSGLRAVAKEVGSQARDQAFEKYIETVAHDRIDQIDTVISDIGDAKPYIRDGIATTTRLLPHLVPMPTYHLPKTIDMARELFHHAVDRVPRVPFDFDFAFSVNIETEFSGSLEIG